MVGYGTGQCISKLAPAPRSGSCQRFSMKHAPCSRALSKLIEQFEVNKSSMRSTHSITGRRGRVAIIIDCGGPIVAGGSWPDWRCCCSATPRRISKRTTAPRGGGCRLRSPVVSSATAASPLLQPPCRPPTPPPLHPTRPGGGNAGCRASELGGGAGGAQSLQLGSLAVRSRLKAPRFAHA